MTNEEQANQNQAAYWARCLDIPPDVAAMLKRLDEQNRLMRRALEAVEYIYESIDMVALPSDDLCPWCLAYADEGHSPDCPRQLALAAEPPSLPCGHPLSALRSDAGGTRCGWCEDVAAERERLYGEGEALPDGLPELLEELAAQLNTAMIIMYGKDPAEIEDATVQATVDRINAAHKVAAAIHVEKEPHD